LAIVFDAPTTTKGQGRRAAWQRCQISNVNGLELVRGNDSSQNVR